MQKGEFHNANPPYAAAQRSIGRNQSHGPNTAITPYFIRQLALEGKVKSVMAGRKRLINLDDLLQYLDLQQTS